MAQYLNPDLDGPLETRGVCPLRLLEQTCSNVGRLNADTAPCRTTPEQHASDKAHSHSRTASKRPCSPVRDVPEKRHRESPRSAEAAARYTCQWMGCGLHFASVQELSRHLHVHVQAQARDASASASASASVSVSVTGGVQQLPTPRASSSSSLSPASTASVSPPPTTSSPLPKANVQSPTLANPAWLASWLVQYLASTNAVNINQPAACNYAQAQAQATLTATGGVNNYLSGLTSPTAAAPRELTGYPVLSPFACGFPNGYSLLTSRFGNAV